MVLLGRARPLRITDRPVAVAGEQVILGSLAADLVEIGGEMTTKRTGSIG